LHHPRIDDWYPFDVAVACALLARARLDLAEGRHIRALEAGATSIRLEKQYAADFENEWREVKARRRQGKEARAPQRFHTYTYEPEHKPKKRKGNAIEHAGKVSYRRAQRDIRRESPPEFVAVEVHRYELLRLAHLSTDAKNRKELDAALRRLTRAVRVNGRRLAPLIAEMDGEDGRLRLRMSGEWLEPPFGKLPLPLPTRSIAATALYLFLHSIRTTPSNRRSKNFKELCERIGIDTSRPPYVCRQAFHRALDIVNDHIARLDERHGINPPDRYRAVMEEGGLRVRFETASGKGSAEQKAAMAEANGDFEEVERIMPVRPRLNRIPVDDIPARQEAWARWDKGDRMAAMQLGVPAKAVGDL
jgi:hypothetical protein